MLSNKAIGEWLAHVQKLGLARNYIDDEGTNRLFIAAGKATRRMPALQEMMLEMRSDRAASLLMFTYKYDEERKAFLASWSSGRARFRLSSATLQTFNIREEQLETGISEDQTKEPPYENQMYDWARAYVSKNVN